MISTAEEYFANLFKISHVGNVPTLAVLLPQSENIYSINLNTRKVEAPEFLSVSTDHQSETVYFLVDRFFDNMDLTTTSCVIQYMNAKQEGRLYAVPYYDIETYHEFNKILIPWCIEGEVTKAAGDITYSIRFFKTSDNGEVLLYNLNTIPATSKILAGMNVLDYYPVTITEDDYNNPNAIFYIKTDDGKYEVAQGKFNNNLQYYALSADYNYSADLLDSIFNRLTRIEQDFNIYWYTV